MKAHSGSAGGVTGFIVTGPEHIQSTAKARKR
jgi:hypothetical protein